MKSIQQSLGPKRRWEKYRKDVVNKRQCAACDSKTTYVNKKGYPVWRNIGLSDGRVTWDDEKDEQWLCTSCYLYYVDLPVKYGYILP